MDEAKSIKKMREQLYDDVWADPITTVAKKYNLSDNGVRKRCKSLNIPLPPFGYWAKKKAGKEVSERPPLPPYNGIILENVKIDDQITSDSLPVKKTNYLELLDLEKLQVEQVAALHGLDLISPESKESFNNWLDSIIVPGRIVSYDYLISSHKTEIEYREARDKAYPFRDSHIKLWTSKEKINERDNISVLPIEVSRSQLSRAYRIADTLIKAFRKLKANISVTNNEKDNICIKLLSSIVSFEISESKTKRRHLISNSQNFRPLYEEVYDGNLQIVWQVNREEGYSYHPRYSNAKKEQPFSLTYSDNMDNPLENQISLMILEVYKQCCENELKHSIERKKQHQQYENERKEWLAEEEAKKILKLNEEKQAKVNTLINGILDKSNNWFKHQQLTRFAYELEKYLASCCDDETIRLLQAYIRLVRENADKLNPLNDIITQMREIEDANSVH